MLISELPKVMLICLVLTVVMETGGALALKVRKPGDLCMVVLVNILTNPLLVSLTSACSVYLGMRAYHISVAFLELAVVFIEGIIYRRSLRWKGNPFILSLILNAFSFLFGKALGLLIF